VTGTVNGPQLSPGRHRGPRLAESVLPVTMDDGVWLVRGHEVLRVRGPAEPLAAAIDLLRHGLPVEETADDRTRAAHRQLSAQLAVRDWLAGHDPDYGLGTPIERQIGYLTLFGGNAAVMQQGISRARVAVLGVGGVGGVIAQHLVGAGVAELWLIDHDHVAVHNLNRQFLAAITDVGEAKTQVAAQSLTRLAPSLRVHLLDEEITSPAQLEQIDDAIDLLVVAADTPPDIARISWRWARPRGIPVCTAAVGLGIGYWGPLLLPAKGHCLHCFEAGRGLRLSQAETLAETAAAGPSPYSFGPANTVVSALCAHELIRFLATRDCAVLNRRGHIRFADSRTSFLDGPPCSCHELGSADNPQ
jgi:ThiF family